MFPDGQGLAINRFHLGQPPQLVEESAKFVQGLGELVLVLRDTRGSQLLPQVGAFLQVTAAHTSDLDVPGQPFTFGRLQLAQALGDLQALESRSRPVLRLHLTDREQGLRQLLDAAAGEPV